ncbi:HEAT repeat domain-containing protein [Xanthomonas medicagonis]|uniref:HEAT repeat domain-containing protein n=1 Tax=Xanthomonas medicagonis TaxID=3160841 RepID=UPI003513FCF6
MIKNIFHFFCFVFLIFTLKTEARNRSEFSSLLVSSVDFCSHEDLPESSCYERLDDYFYQIYDMSNVELSAKIDDASIMAVCSLLGHENYMVRYRAARILGAMGKAATIALPRLRAAEADSKPKFGGGALFQGQEAEKAIGLAIERIEGER